MRMRDREEGFTLVELLVVMVLLGVVGGVVVNAIVTGSASARASTARTMALHDLEIALQRVGRDLRAADPLYVTSGTDAEDYGRQVGAEIVRDRSVHFVTFGVETIDGRQQLVQDTASVDLDELIESGLPIDDLITTQPRRTLVTEVDNPTDVFTYFDREGEPITCRPGIDASKEDCDLLYSDAYQLGIRLERVVAGQQPVQAETRINVRNMRYRSS
jgi:prepilin-type N-terminal cleavage/methylation domain-containing protein